MRHAKGLIEAGAKVMATDVDQAGTVSRHPPPARAADACPVDVTA